ncbi:MAG: hypothetical protein WHV67_06365 [Thermoanaerobaculia bacterium]
MEIKFKREILYLLTVFFTLILALYAAFKGDLKEIFSLSLGSLLGISSFEMTYHLVYSLTGSTKKLNLKIALFFIVFLTICTLIILFSKSIIYTILGYTIFVVSLIIMIFKEILNA